MLTIHIGDKRYSSWSLRGWFPLAHFGIPFREVPLRLATPEFHRAIAAVSPARRVPVLVDGDFAVWDTLAIVEYLAERNPQHAIWPADSRARARARSICAEMHSGFTELRTRMPMNAEAALPGFGWSLAVQKDIDRLVAMWSDALAQSGGPFLFGAAGAADGYFAPVCLRFDTYRPALPERISRYVADVLALPAVKRWLAEARAENAFRPEYEPYRAAPR